MKTPLKIFAFIFLVTVTMMSCSSSGGGMHGFIPDELDYPRYPYDPETLKKLHDNIRPTKPIKIPDTMRIVAADPALYIITQDSVPQDTTPQDSIN